MNKILKAQFNALETIWQRDENDTEFMYARDLQKTLGYTEWRNFEDVIKRGIISCENAEYKVSDHFVELNKMIDIGKGGQREVKDYKLTRYACYLTAQNGDSRKEQIAFAQNYFATQTRKYELVEQRYKDYERVLERYELREAERIFSEELYQRGVDEQGFARVRSKGDEALFNKTTLEMKEHLGITTKDQQRPLADFLDPALVTAKKLAVQLSNIAIKNKNLIGEISITEQHINSNKTLRNAFIKETGLSPEDLPPAEDIKKVESRLNKDIKTIKPKKSKDLGL